jgi:hypothetical protein
MERSVAERGYRAKVSGQRLMRIQKTLFGSAALRALTQKCPRKVQGWPLN